MLADMDNSADRYDQLAIQSQSGDRAAFRQLVLALHDDLRAWIGWRVASVEMVDDVLQETLVAAWRSLGDYRSEGTFRAWIRGIARHRCLMALRERRRQLAREAHGIEHALIDQALEATDDTADDDAWRVAALRQCLDRLPDHARRLIEARYWRGEPLADLVAHLGKPKGTIAAMLHRIRKRLQTCINAQEPSL
jgi:RNA polymerase sigma-70 factor, ECF subfamily